MARSKDPVCGMTIDRETAPARIEVRGQTYYFCSPECARTFAADPERYLAEAADSTAAPRERLEEHEPRFTTTGLLTSPKFGAAGSGGLEYELLPEAHDRKGT